MRLIEPSRPEAKDLKQYESTFLHTLYRKMVLIRRFEERVNELYLQGIMPGTIHLSLGQEAVTVGACSALRDDDMITLTHRGHGQALAKGVSTNALMAELFGKSTGCCRGKGGSLHVGDMSVGAVPAIAIVGASSPIATGLAYAFRRHGEDRVAMNFFGDGTVNKGDWHEAMNLAAIWDLPVVFLCENNMYGVSTHVTDILAIETIAERADGYGMPGERVYGNDPIEVFETVERAVKRARSGDGPTLIEAVTYRRGGHKRDDPGHYRPDEEVEMWMKEDPIPAFRSTLQDAGIATDADLTRIEERVDAELEAAVEFALESPEPDVASALEDVYA